MMMGNVKHYLRIGMVSLFLFNFSIGQDMQAKIESGNTGNSTEARLGLLAMHLGLSPVAGYNDGDTVQIDGPSQGEAVAASSAAGYSIPEGAHGGNLVSPTQCQCVPPEQCPSYHGSQQGGNLPVSPPAPGGDNYDGQHGGNLPISPPTHGEGSYGGGIVPIPESGGSGPGSPGGQHGGNLPISPPAHGEGSYGGGIVPIPESGGSGPGGQHGGNIPVSGSGSGSYGGSQGGIVPVPEGQHGGNIPVSGGPGYSGGDGGGGDVPNKDGSGLLDLRIVNRPPRPGGVQCLNGNVFCCDLGGSSKPSNPGPGGSGGYVTCGSRNFIDVPGKPLEYGDAKFGAYPWMAVILGKANNYVGAGALISPNFVLTAAHKIKSWQPGASMKARFGEWNAKEDDEPYKNIEVPIADVTIHPGFNPKNLQNDIALVRLAHPIDVKSYPHIKSVCLPQQDYQYAGQRCWVAGFGKDAFGTGKHSYIMKEVDLPILDSNDCEQRLRTTRLGKYFELNRRSFLCAGGEEGKDTCTGDGGSPLVCETGNGGQWQVAGLVAWGIGCADYGIPGVYVNVPNYLDWIDQEIYKY